MYIALKFEEDPMDAAEGWETVCFRTQMLRDVYYHEGEILPTLEDFLHKPLTRDHDQTFWVYRQGTYIPSYVFFHGGLVVGHALKAELDQEEPTLEGYTYVNSLRLESGGKLATEADARYTLREQWDFLTDLYENLLEN